LPLVPQGYLNEPHDTHKPTGCAALSSDQPNAF
jgi:hypothetical protein